MKDYLQDFARFLAQTGALFFARDLRLKDGRATPYFVNLGQINTGRRGLALAGFLARMLLEEKLVDEKTVLIGPSYKGSALACLVAAALWLEAKLEVPFDYDRKEAKGHGEASGRENLFVTGALQQAGRLGGQALVLDDVATSLATKVELLDKMRAQAPEVAVRAVVIAVDREQTQPVHDAQGRLVENVKGPDAVKAFSQRTGVPVRAVAPIRAVIEVLFRQRVPVRIDGAFRPLEQADKDLFDAYMAVYGR